MEQVGPMSPPKKMSNERANDIKEMWSIQEPLDSLDSGCVTCFSIQVFM